MTNPVFVVPSVEKSPDCSRNRPINISHCTCLTKEYFFSVDLTIYMIWFEGCVDARDELLTWGYSTQQERDADYDRILTTFAVSTETQPVHSPAEPEPEPASLHIRWQRSSH